jgi:hypothetical protein
MLELFKLVQGTESKEKNLKLSLKLKYIFDIKTRQISTKKEK